MSLYTSPSFRQGLPESRLQGRLSLPSLALDTRCPAGMTAFMYKGMGLT